MDKRSIPKTILVVEDDTAIGEMLQMVLTIETPYHVVLATNGVEALDIVEHLFPCLFLLDYHLPGMNGLELYDQLHAMPSLANVPALLMSASLPKKEAEKRHLSTIHKPFDLNNLTQVIEQITS